MEKAEQPSRNFLGSAKESGKSSMLEGSLDMSQLSGSGTLAFKKPMPKTLLTSKPDNGSGIREKVLSMNAHTPSKIDKFGTADGKHHERAKSGFSTTLNEYLKGSTGKNTPSPEGKKPPMNRKITEEDEDFDAPEERLYREDVNPMKLRKPMHRLPYQLSECNPTQGSTASQERKNTIHEPENSAHSNDNDNYEEFQYTVLDSKRSMNSNNLSAGDADRFNFNKFRDNITFSGLTPIDAKIISSNTVTLMENGKEKCAIVLVWSEGTLYQGELKNGLFHGQGHLKHSEGYSITGTFKEGKVEGQAKYDHGPLTYEGLWSNSTPEGLGKEILHGIYEYQGNFSGGKKSGKGKMQVIGRGEYEGQFRGNLFNGEGAFRWHNGKKYEGFWYNNKMHGKGKTIWPDGRRYFGRYNSNHKEGFGRFIWADGREYIGYWRNGKQEGKAWYIDLNGQKHDTFWENGILTS